MRFDAAERGFARIMPIAGQGKGDVPCRLGIDSGIVLQGVEDAVKFTFIACGVELIRPGQRRVAAFGSSISADIRPKRGDFRG